MSSENYTDVILEVIRKGSKLSKEELLSLKNLREDVEHMKTLLEDSKIKGVGANNRDFLAYYNRDAFKKVEPVERIEKKLDELIDKLKSFLKEQSKNLSKEKKEYLTILISKIDQCKKNIVRILGLKGKIQKLMIDGTLSEIEAKIDESFGDQENPGLNYLILLFEKLENFETGLKKTKEDLQESRANQLKKWEFYNLSSPLGKILLEDWDNTQKIAKEWIKITNSESSPDKIFTFLRYFEKIKSEKLLSNLLKKEIYILMSIFREEPDIINRFGWFGKLLDDKTWKDIYKIMFFYKNDFYVLETNILPTIIEGGLLDLQEKRNWPKIRSFFIKIHETFKDYSEKGIIGNYFQQVDGISRALTQKSLACMIYVNKKLGCIAGIFFLNTLIRQPALLKLLKKEDWFWPALSRFITNLKDIKETDVNWRIICFLLNERLINVINEKNWPILEKKIIQIIDLAYKKKRDRDWGNDFINFIKDKNINRDNFEELMDEFISTYQ